MERSSVISSKIKHDLQEVERIIAETCVAEQELLHEASLATLQAGGKRLRPALVLIAGQTGCYSLEKLAPAAAALELIHMASLVHDDILDNATTRRGIPTVNSRWGNRVAVTTGDFLFAHAFVMLAAIGNDEVNKIGCNAAIALSLGELHQIETTGRCAQNLKDYLNKIFEKTAALFSASCEIGAILSDAADADRALLAKYGENLGMAFQIYDDILDLEGSEDALGKPIGIDLKDGTVTMPILYALEESNNDPMICSVIENKEPKHSEIKAAIELILSTNAISRTKKEAQKYARAAIEAAGEIGVSEVRDDLVAIGEFVVERYH